VLLVLVAITLGHLALDRSADAHGSYRASSRVTAIVIMLALVKVRRIFREFMQVRNAPVLRSRLADRQATPTGAALPGSCFHWGGRSPGPRP